MVTENVSYKHGIYTKNSGSFEEIPSTTISDDYIRSWN
jgi:hypothetical protein